MSLLSDALAKVGMTEAVQTELLAAVEGAVKATVATELDQAKEQLKGQLLAELKAELMGEIKAGLADEIRYIEAKVSELAVPWIVRQIKSIPGYVARLFHRK